MKQIAVLLPTYKRANKIPSIVENFNKTSKKSNLYWIIVPGDTETKEELDKLNQNYWVVDLEYTQSINYGVKKTKEPFILCFADDAVLMPNWEEKILKLTEDKTKHIFGGTDSWKLSRTMLHISHPLVRRSYVEEKLGGNLYHTEYIHYMNDIELVQRGLKEECVSITPEVLIEHNHPILITKDESKWDDTYNRSSKLKEKDIAIYDRRSGEFAMYDHNYFWWGFTIPTKLNPIYNKTLVSIVIPSYNDIDFLIQCLESIIKNTYYRYEIIIINDNSDELQKTNLLSGDKDFIEYGMVNTKKFMDSFELPDKSCEIRVVHNSEQKWINYNWNLGAEMAKGNYVVIINSDITVSYHWDKFLVAGLEMPEYKFPISCPMERTPQFKQPFGLFPYFKKYAPNMIKGPCFMFRKSDVDRLFPIPEQIKHWCGDNVIADRAEKFGGVVFVKFAEIFHYVTQSGKTVKRSKYIDRIYEDVCEYEKWSGKNMNFVKKTIKLQNYYSQFGEDKWIDENIELPKNGYYVDVGAGDPVNSSNTKFLEDKGWSGTCIDADPTFIEQLRLKRKAEVIEAVVSNKTEKTTLYISECSYLTSVNKLKTKVIEEKEVKTKALKDIIKRHIDYLSIDVEGNELKVCGGIDWSDPPDIIVIEHLTWNFPSKRDEIVEYFKKLPYILVFENDVNLVFKKTPIK